MQGISLVPNEGVIKGIKQMNLNESKETEVVVVVAKKKKNITRACEVCQRLRRKCTGTIPCEYCQKKGRECKYVEPTKRGPKKRKTEGVPSPSDPSAKDQQQLSDLQVTSTEHRLWMENERNYTVDSFFTMRCWWTHLLDREVLSSPSTMEHQVISNTIKAFMARYMKHTQSAQQLFHHAFQTARQIYTVPSMESVNTFLLMAEFIPTHYPMFFTLAWDHAKQLTPKNKREIRLRSYAYMCFILCSMPPIPNSQKITLLHQHTNEFMNEHSADLYDVAYVLMLQITRVFISQFGSFYSPDFFQILQETTLDNQVYMEVLRDANTFEWIIRSNPLLFGDEMLVITQLMKAIIHWRSGSSNFPSAVSECSKLLDTLRTFGNRIVYLQKFPEWAS